MPRFEAVIVDLDGVITRTADLHARAWKRTFDAYLKEHHPDERPFDIESDYRTTVDGKPRFDGVRSFLKSRKISLPEGASEDPAERPTVRGLAHRKNEHFHELLDRDGVHTFPDAVDGLRRWRSQGLKTGVVSSSKNGRHVLEVAGIADLFDTRVDGIDAAEIGLRGKPAPDAFVEAARRLDVMPRRAVVIEDAVAGVEAARAGGFGLVVGLAREDGSDALRTAGADLVVHDLSAIDVQITEHE